MRQKTFDLIETKADGEPGHFSALASVFGNVDSVGDRMIPGAFKKTLANMREKGKTLPVVFSHEWNDPMKYIGEADPRAVVEDEKGLLVQGKLDIANGNPVADQVYKAMKNGWITGWSFGYTVAKGGEKLDKNGINEVSEVELIEVGPTLKGANPEAQTQSIKSLLEIETKDADEIIGRLDATCREFLSSHAEDPRAEGVRSAMEQLAGEAKADEPPDTSSAAPAAKEAEATEPQAPPSAPDPLKNEIDRLRLEIAVGRPL